MNASAERGEYELDKLRRSINSLNERTKYFQSCISDIQNELRRIETKLDSRYDTLFKDLLEHRLETSRSFNPQR